MIQLKNTRSYLLYALGEIILVVVGILIALQVNNWKEEQKREELSFYVHSQSLSTN